MILVAIAAFLLLVTVVTMIARPFLVPVTYVEEGPSLEQLRADRTRLRAQLRELDMDFETGKLAPEEYEKLRGRRLEQIERTTRAIHATEPHEPPSPASEPAILAISDAELERRIEDRKEAMRLAARCPGCGAATQDDDRFCRRCGTDLQATAEAR